MFFINILWETLHHDQRAFIPRMIEMFDTKASINNTTYITGLNNEKYNDFNSC